MTTTPDTTVTDTAAPGTAQPAPRQPGPVRRTLGILRPHIGRDWPLMGGGALVLLLEVAFRVLEPWPTKFVVDAVTASLGAHVPGAFAPTLTLLVVAGAALVAIVGLRALANFTATVLFSLAGSRIATRLRTHVFEHVQALSDGFHARSRKGDVVQRLVSDVNKLQEVATTAGLPLLANLLTLFVMAIVMVVIDPLLACVVYLACAVYWLSSRGTTDRITQASRKTRAGEGRLANTAHEALGAIHVVHTYALEPVVAERFGGANATTLRDGVRSKRLAAALERRTDVIVGVATALVLVGGGWRVLEGAMTPGDLVLFLTYLKTTMKPLRDLAKYTGRIARALASGERVADLLEVPVEIADYPLARDLTWSRGALSFRGVTAGYRTEDGGPVVPVLRNLDLDVPAGQKLAIVGPSGAGKSTLGQLVPRLLDPIEGNVELDGLDVRNVTLDSLRRHVAVVPQDTVLFSGSIRENIRYGRLDATDTEVEDAARRACAHDFVSELPGGYETLVGERGGTLSGGQRQRIAVARALLRNSAVVLLDEATTGLDPDSAASVLEAIDHLTTGRTTLAITHDAATALAADRVVWIEHGRVQLDGTPEALLRDPDSAFARWVGAQEGGSQDTGSPDTGTPVSGGAVVSGGAAVSGGAVRAAGVAGPVAMPKDLPTQPIALPRAGAARSDATTSSTPGGTR
ncbi:ABC transporter ATP-binding protein [Brevibacterium samyangense]|uniref:ABC transporter ATP-binding protein n=1 Tax=Brevibacterium samyangense TaxID=366888 RepID=A0ABP5EQ43_9MICO